MPLYVGDYLGDTGHLGTTQHGAYFLLMMHYWRQGELPDDDRQLASITKLPLRIWLEIRPVMQAFFHDGWRHKRIDEELAKMTAAAERRAAAGQKGGQRAAMNRMLLEDAARRSSNATATLNHSHSPKILTTTVSEDTGKGLAGKKPLLIQLSPEALAAVGRKQ